MIDVSTQASPSVGWRDEPLTNIADDRFQRAPVAERIARLIDENHTPESSVVYGLEGPWGSGKSSVVAFITHYLSQPSDREWAIVPFNPWATSGTDGMFSEFFAALSTLDPKGKKSNLRELIVSYADLASPMASLIPFIGKGAEGLTTAMAARLQRPWNVAFDELSQALRDVGLSVLIVVDDIDRLQTGELLDLLKVVRLLGRFPGVDFLLCYDEQTLIETLHGSGQIVGSKTRARAFMEKIVQYPLSIPPILTNRIVRILNTELENLITPERVATTFDKDRFSDVLLTTMPRQLTTPRAIERFLAQIREQFRAHDLDEVNEADLIMATFIRVRFPDVFSLLQAWKPKLTKVGTTYSGVGKRDEESRPDWHPLVGVLEEAEDREDALTVLEAIFPALSDRGSLPVLAGRFAHPDYFDRYLAQAIPEGDIPDAHISQALQKAATGDQADLFGLVHDGDTDRVTLALSKIRSRYPDVGGATPYRGPVAPVTLSLLAMAMTLVDEADNRSAQFDSPYDYLQSWAATILRQLLESDPEQDVDEALLACKEDWRRVDVLVTANRRLGIVREATQAALIAALERETDRLVPILLQDLRDGDRSDERPGVGYTYQVVRNSPHFEDLKSQIAEGLSGGEFSIQDVAARFVGRSYLSGGSGLPTSASFNGELFTEVTGVPARTIDNATTGEWPDETWARRREFAAKYIDQPNRGVEVIADEDPKSGH